MKRFYQIIPIIIVLLNIAIFATGFSAGLSDNWPDDSYIGNYFNIEQETATTGGTIKRHIDISIAWSGAYVFEDMKVEGKAEIRDSFKMNNLKPGNNAVSDWYNIDFGEVANPDQKNFTTSENANPTWGSLATDKIAVPKRYNPEPVDRPVKEWLDLF